MRLLGLLFILVGVLLCCTVLFWFAGLPAIGVGALLYMAGEKRPQSPVQVTPRRWTTRDTLILSTFAALLLVGLVVVVTPSAKPSGRSVVSHHWEAPPPGLAQRAKPAKASRVP